MNAFLLQALLEQAYREQQSVHYDYSDIREWNVCSAISFCSTPHGNEGRAVAFLFLIIDRSRAIISSLLKIKAKKYFLIETCGIFQNAVAVNKLFWVTCCPLLKLHPGLRKLLFVVDCNFGL